MSRTALILVKKKKKEREKRIEKLMNFVPRISQKNGTTRYVQWNLDTTTLLLKRDLSTEYHVEHIVYSEIYLHIFRFYCTCTVKVVSVMPKTSIL